VTISRVGRGSRGPRPVIGVPVVVVVQPAALLRGAAAAPRRAQHRL